MDVNSGEAGSEMDLEDLRHFSDYAAMARSISAEAQHWYRVQLAAGATVYKKARSSTLKRDQPEQEWKDE
jgi:hypothetical protein